MFLDLAGKKALVTGASSGLGAHFSRVLAQANVEVVLAARRESALRQVAGDIAAEGGRSRTVVLDVTDTAMISGLAEVFADIDILVNNAGLVIEGTALDQSELDWDVVMGANLKGAFLVAQAVGRAMRGRGAGGSIINIASVLGLRQAGGVLPYSVSKAGLIQMTKSLALEWARFGVRVNALAPGYIETDLNRDFWDGDAGKAMLRRIPQRRLGRLADLDGPLLLLASDASAYMTGAVLAVDGGHLVSSL